MMKPRTDVWVSANEAIELLGVSRATLYAYVSRGRIRSEATAGKTRNRRYARDDIERLRARTDERRNPEKAAEHALHWGLPILESAITLIADGRIYYRGRDAAELARTSSLADVAALLWTGQPSRRCAARRRRRTSAATKGRAADASFVARAQATLALAAAKDPLGYDLRPRASRRPVGESCRCSRTSRPTAAQRPAHDRRHAREGLGRAGAPRRCFAPR